MGWERKKKGEKEKMTSGVYTRKKITEEHRKNLSLAAKELYKKGFINPMKNKHQSIETKKRISKARKKMFREGKLHNPETIQKIRNTLKGHVVTEKTRCKLRNAIVTHHINGNHNDNRPKNLMVMPSSSHTKLHWEQGDIGGRPKCHGKN